MTDPRVPFPRDLDGERSSTRQACFILGFVFAIVFFCWLAESDYNPVGLMMRLAFKILDPIFKFFL